jgi:hypothetical protein
LHFSVFFGWIWLEMKKAAEYGLVGDDDPLLGLPSPVVSPEVVAWLYGVLSLFCQNKLDDVSSYSWMLQKTSFADGPYSRGSLF